MVTGTAPPFGLIFLLIPNGGGMTRSADRDLRGSFAYEAAIITSVIARYAAPLLSKGRPGVGLSVAFKQLCH